MIGAYTTDETMHRLHISRSTLYRLTRRDQLHPIRLSEPDRRLHYPCEEVEALARAWGEVTLPYQVVAATDADLAQHVALSLDHLGSPATLRWSFLRTLNAQQPDLVRVVTSWHSDRVVGSFCLIPLCERSLDAIQRETQTLAHLTAADLSADPTDPLLLAAFLVDPAADIWRILAALTRTLLQTLYVWWTRIPTPRCLVAQPGLDLPAVLEPLLGLAPAPTEGGMRTLGKRPSLLGVLHAISQLPDHPAWPYQPTHWVDDLVQDEATFLDAVLRSFFPSAAPHPESPFIQRARAYAHLLPPTWISPIRKTENNLSPYTEEKQKTIAASRVPKQNESATTTPKGCSYG